MCLDGAHSADRHLPEARFWITDPDHRCRGTCRLPSQQPEHRDCLPVTQDKAVVERCNAGYNITRTLVLIRELYSV
jgi:hypothetical protein